MVYDFVANFIKRVLPLLGGLLIHLVQPTLTRNGRAIKACRTMNSDEWERL
jgi:hypothetical protein